MAPRSAPASAEVNREAGRRGHRLGAFFVVRRLVRRRTARARRRLGAVRRLLVLVSVIVFVDTMLFGAIIPLVPGFADDFGLSKLQAGLLVGAYGAGAVIGGIPAGIVAARIGPKRTVVVGLAVLALASVAFALGGSPAALGVARFAQGFASAVTWAGALAWLTLEHAARAARPDARHGVRLRGARGHRRPGVRRASPS